MNLKSSVLAVSLALAAGALALAPAAFAADGTVTISGKVLSSTCTATVSSNGSSTVTLAPVPFATLNGAGITANPTAFSLMLTGCPQVPGSVKVGAIFATTNADTTTLNGTLLNTATGGATKVDVQVKSTGGAVGTTAATATTGGTAVAFDGSTVTDQVALDSTGNAVLGYYAQYYATAALTASNAGAVQTSAIFTLNYQ